MLNICPPALIYLLFSLAQIIIDTFSGLYNSAFMKSVIMIMVTFLLNALCQGGLGIVSWIIVFIPFIMMTTITTILLYTFGLNASTGSFNYDKSCEKNCSKSSCKKKVIIIPKPFLDSSDAKEYPMIKNYSGNNECRKSQPSSKSFDKYQGPPPMYSSSPEYESFLSYK